MGKMWKLLLPVPEETGADYLILEDDADGSTGGAFVYHLSTTNPEICFDDWYEFIENAKNVATEYEMSVEDWQVMQSED